MANATAAQRQVLKVPAASGSGHGAAADAVSGSAAGAATGTDTGSDAASVLATVPGEMVPGAKDDAAAIQVSATWACSAQTLDAKGQAGAPLTESLTVGQLFVVNCEGATVPLQPDKIFLLAPKNNQYGLRLLQLREMAPSTAGLNKVSFVATTYVASEEGPLPLSGYVLTDGKTAVGMSPLQLQSHTVITQDKNPDKKPFGPFGPMMMNYPLWLWLCVVLVAASFATAIAYIIFRRVERRKFMAELNNETTVLSPYNQFNKELRSLGRMGVITETLPWTAERAKEMLTTLQAALRWYIAREFEIPAHKLPLVRTLEELYKLRARRLGARFQADEKELATALREMQRALEHPSTVSLGEIQQLSELCRGAVERLNKWPITRASTVRSKKPAPEVTP